MRGLGFCLVGLGVFWFCFQAVPQVEGIHSFHPFLVGAVREWACLCLLVCLCAGQSSGAARAELL